MSFQDLRCNHIDHKQKEIQMVCVNEICDKQRPGCLDCLKQLHKQHLDEMLEFDQFNTWRYDGVKFFDHVQAVIGETESVIQQLKSFVKQFWVDVKLDLNSLTIDQITNQVKQILEQKKICQVIQKDLQTFNDSICQIKSKIKELKQIKSIIDYLLLVTQNQKSNLQEFQYPVVKQEKTTTIGKNEKEVQQKQNSEKIINSKYEKQKAPVDQLLLNFTFSKHDKNQFIRLSQGGLIAEMTGLEIDQGFCMCSQAMSLQDGNYFKVKILQQGYEIMIGVCDKKIVKQAKYELNLDKLGHGCYLLDQNGMYFSQDTQDFCVDEPLKFGKKETVAIKINWLDHTISWINQSGQVFSAKFKSQEQLYPCVFLSSESKVEIINE